MYKLFMKVVVIIIFVLLVMPCPAYAEVDELPVLEKPVSLSVRSDEYGDLQLRMTQPAKIMELMEEEYGIFWEIDWKINDGQWKFDSHWDNFSEQYLIEYYENLYEWFNVALALNHIGHDERNSIDVPVFPESLQVEEFDLQNNTYSFRYRYVYEYEHFDPATETWGYRFVTSPYSDIASIGKDAAGRLPDSLVAPENLKGELKEYKDGQPYFYFTCNIPESVEESNKQTSIWNLLDWKIGNGKWASESNGILLGKGHENLIDDMDVDPIDEGGWGEIDIKKNTYYFRMFFQFQKPDGSYVRSPFSNVVEIGTTAFYSGASSWAEPELQAAYDKDLIPDILMGTDMTQPITREEFAELAVRLCEKSIDEAILPASPNPFTDTVNNQILKAFKLGITTGTSATKFSPNVLINREQCATMLYRAIKAIAPAADYSINGVKDFPDQRDISSWAVEGTKYMSKLGIIKGDSKGNFMPKSVTPAQEAAKYGMATREAAILMTVRTSDKLSDIKANTTQPAVTPTPVPASTPTPVPTSTPTSAPAASSVEKKLDELAAKGNKINQIYYEWTSYANGEKLQDGKAWMKGNMAKKQEPVSSGGYIIYIYDMEKHESIAYTLGQNTAYIGVYDPNDPQVASRPTDIFSLFMPVNLKLAGTETVDGQVCTVLVQEEEGMEVGKVWVSEETGLKLREEYILMLGTPKITVIYDYITIDDKVDDAVFELPKGMEIDTLD